MSQGGRKARDAPSSISSARRAAGARRSAAERIAASTERVRGGAVDVDARPDPLEKAAEDLPHFWLGRRRVAAGGDGDAHVGGGPVAIEQAHEPWRGGRALASLTTTSSGPPGTDTDTDTDRGAGRVRGGGDGGAAAR